MDDLTVTVAAIRASEQMDGSIAGSYRWARHQSGNAQEMDSRPAKTQSSAPQPAQSVPASARSLAVQGTQGVEVAQTEKAADSGF